MMPSRPNAQNSNAMLPCRASIPFADVMCTPLNKPPPPMHAPLRNTVPVVSLFLSSKIVGYNGIQWMTSPFGINIGIPRLISSLMIQPAVIITYFTFIRSHSCLVPSNSRHRSRSR
jgi:hypothetical protein